MDSEVKEVWDYIVNEIINTDFNSDFFNKNIEAISKKVAMEILTRPDIGMNEIKRILYSNPIDSDFKPSKNTKYDITVINRLLKDRIYKLKIGDILFEKDEYKTGSKLPYNVEEQLRNETKEALQKVYNDNKEIFKYSIRRYAKKQKEGYRDKIYKICEEIYNRKSLALKNKSEAAKIMANEINKYLLLYAPSCDPISKEKLQQNM